MPNPPAEIGIRELRTNLSDVVNAASAYGQVTFITLNGRRVAAIVPVVAGEEIASSQSGGAQ